jgi:prepilin-type processing-associated H-X9-DG protein
MFAEDSDSGNTLISPPFAPRGSLTGNLLDNGQHTLNGGHGADDGTQLQLASDDLNWLYGFGGEQPSYMKALKSFTCPTTQNIVTNNGPINPVNPEGTMDVYKLMQDLGNKAKDKYSTSGPYPYGGHSYEVFGWWHRYDLAGKFPRKTLRTVQTYVNVNYLPGLIPGPSKIFTIMDRLEPHPGNNENAPNKYDGHGMAGANVVFTDGHAQFVSVKRWYDVYRTSEDDSVLSDGQP